MDCDQPSPQLQSTVDPHPTPDSWHQAVTDYTNTLTPSQQREFKAPATVEQCLQILTDNRTRKKAFTRILELVRPIVDPLKRFEGAIDVVVQISSGIASPIWGPLRLVITIASEHFKTLERLTFIIDKVARSIQRFQDFEKLFASHQGVRNAVGALYCDLIHLCTRVVRFYTRSFRYLLVSFDKEFGSIFESINLHASDVDQFALAAHIKEVAEAREKDSAEKQAQKLHQLQLWLSPSTVEDDLQSHLAEYMTGSLDWVVTTTEFSQWLEGSPLSCVLKDDIYGNRVPAPPAGTSLEVVGPPGSGKSTLAAFLIQHISKASPRVLYFFCNNNDSEKRESIFVLRTLLAQLLKADPNLASHILPIYQKSGRPLADSHTLVLEAFEAALELQQDFPVYVVIDGIDECRDAWDRNGLLHQLQTSKNTNLRFLISRRDSLPNRQDIPWSATHELTMNPGLASPYIYQYLEERVRGIPTIANSDIRSEVVTTISKSSDGLWLYARLMADEVERAPSKERVQQRLVSLPHGLFNLYSQILQSSEAQMTSDHRQFAQSLFLWLDISDYLPDFLSERFDCLQYPTLQLIFSFVNGGSDVFDTAALARELGSPLLQVCQVESTYELDFVHRSVYQYLAQCPRLPYSELPLILRPQRLKQLYRGIASVWYFTESSDCVQKLARLRDTSAFSEFLGSDLIGSHFEMTYALWNAFKFRLPSDLAQDEMEEVENMLQRLIRFLQSGEALMWFEMATIINYSGNYVQLLDNILECLWYGPKPYFGVYKTATLETFSRQRYLFFLNWAYIIRQTTPWYTKGRGRMEMTELEKPEKFDENRTACQMMRIAERWGDISFKNTETPSSHGIFGQKGRLDMCNGCSKVFTNLALRKHYPYGCKRSPWNIERLSRKNKAMLEKRSELSN